MIHSLRTSLRIRAAQAQNLNMARNLNARDFVHLLKSQSFKLCLPHRGLSTVGNVVPIASPPASTTAAIDPTGETAMPPQAASTVAASILDEPIRLTFTDRWLYLRKSKREKVERFDIAMIEKYQSLMQSLCGDIITISMAHSSDERHPSESASRAIKEFLLSKPTENTARIAPVIVSLLDEVDAQCKLQLAALESDMKVLRTLKPSITLSETENTTSTVGSKLSDHHLWNCQAYLRLRLLSEYISRSSKAISEDESIIDLQRLSCDRLIRIVDAFLVGSASERVLEHMSLYSDTITNPQIHSCFYSLYEAEVETARSSFTMMDGLYKDHGKVMKKFAKDYLLDRLELDIKARCVFAWSDPTFSGFQPVPDETLLPIDDLIKGRQLFFKEGTSVASKFIGDYLADRRIFYEEKAEMRGYFKMGFIFFIVVCMLDDVVMSI